MSINMMLKGHELFASLNVDEIDQLSTFSSVKDFRNKETIFEFDQPSTHFYMMMEGVVYLQLPAVPVEFSFAISKAEKGELIGISSLLNSPRYTSSARCYEDTKVLSIEAKPFRELLILNCAAGVEIMTQTAKIYFNRYTSMVKRLHDIVSQEAIAF